MVSSVIPVVYFYLSFIITLILIRIGACLDIFLIYRKTGRKDKKPFRGRNNKAWFGVLLTLVLPGLGHLYLKKYLYAVIFVSLYFMINQIKMDLYVFSAVSLIYMIIVVSHLIKQSQCHSLKFFKNHVSCLFFVLAFNSGINLIATTYFSPVAPSVGSSMEPTIISGDVLVANKYTYRQREPYVGEVVLIKAKDFDGKPVNLVKRIVATENEFVTVTDNTVYVNGKIRFNGGRSEEKDNPEPSEEFKPLVVPIEHYFVIGDNLNDSVDSRHVGPIHKDIILGKIVKILWPINRAGLVE
jgi:signal peptidase I